MIIQATLQELNTLVCLALLLWPNHTANELEEEFTELLKEPSCACFLAYQDGQPVGFAQCQLRHDYVEGTDSSPVGYLEGIFVKQDFRLQGYARALLKECEAWARTNGCEEFASDCELTNESSRQFHQTVGFKEANRIICFVKKL